MSESLLPVANVDIFTLDKKTAAVADKLSQDWRFARVTMDVVTEGGIEAATERYTAQESPDLVIVEVDNIGDGFIDLLEGLAGSCVEGTDAIIIGPTNDVHLYRQLVGMGVRDYLVRPVSEEDLGKVISEVLVEKKGLSESRLVAVLGSKGGVGTTTVAQLMAWDIAEELGQKTMMLDAAGGWGSFGISFGAESSSTMIEALRTARDGTDEDMVRLFQSYSDNLSLLVTGGDAMLEDVGTADDFEHLIDRIMTTYPVVVIDLSGASGDVKNRILARAHETVLVTTPVLPALRGARTLLSEIKSLRGSADGVDLVVNMQGAAGALEVPKSDMKTALDIEPDIVIPFEPKIFATAEANGTPAPKDKEGRKIADGFLNLARQAADYKGKSENVNEDAPSFLDKILGKGK